LSNRNGIHSETLLPCHAWLRVLLHKVEEETRQKPNDENGFQKWYDKSTGAKVMGERE